MEDYPTLKPVSMSSNVSSGEPKRKAQIRNKEDLFFFPPQPSVAMLGSVQHSYLSYL